MSPVVLPARRPEPVKAAGLAAGIVSGLATVAVGIGWVTQAEADSLADVLVAVVSALAVFVSAAAPYAAALRARRKVTPVESPAVTVGGEVVAAELEPIR